VPPHVVKIWSLMEINVNGYVFILSVLITTGQTLHNCMCPCIALWVPVRIMGRFISRMMLYHLYRCSGQILSTSLCVEFSEFIAFGTV
jgi:NhaP-type Na+/H+ or K+/H+ antiporter